MPASLEVLEERLRSLRFDLDRLEREKDEEITNLRDKEIATLKAELISTRRRSTQLIIAISTVMISLAGLLLGIVATLGK